MQFRSQDLAGHPDIHELLDKCRWIHIDGEHSESAISNDLEVAARLLSANGVISIDDFMLHSYPHLTRAAFRFLDSRASDISLFLYGFGKGYLCRPPAKHAYLSYIKESIFADMAARGCAEITIFKTNTPNELNCFGIGPRFMDFDYYGLDADQSAVVIK